MKKILYCIIAIILVLSGCSSNNGKEVEGKLGASITSIKNLDKIADSAEKADKKASRSDAEAKKQREEENTDDENNAQNGSNEVTQPSSNGTSDSSNASSSFSSNNNESSSSNNSNNSTKTCSADNPYKYFYTNENGEVIECPGIYDPVPEEKPNYVCEFGMIDKMQPCNYTRPEETGPFGVFATQAESFADAHARGYETGQYTTSFIYDNMGNQVWTYFPL